MDMLNYEYDPGNKLTKVSDVSSIEYGFKDGTNTNDDFEYDPNGNLTLDRNKGITGIEYNYLNLPTKITVAGDNNGTIDYIYTTDGTKLRKITTEGDQITNTEYCGDFVYENGDLKQFYQPEGYIEPDGEGAYIYVYQYADIWGNTRLTYADDNGDGSVTTSEIRREQNYYPFGLEHKGYNGVINGTKNNLKTYQSQEFTEDLGLNVHEWRYRMSDPSTGRFWQIDPLAEDYYYNSTYAFQENTLGMGIELEGLENLDWNELSEENLQEGLLSGSPDGSMAPTVTPHPEPGVISSTLGAIGGIFGAVHSIMVEATASAIRSVTGTIEPNNVLSDSEFNSALSSGDENAFYAGFELDASTIYNEAPNIAAEALVTGAEIVVSEGLSASKTQTKKVHGNSKASTKRQHGYKISDVNTGEVLEYGISGQKLNKNGSSPRIAQKLRTKYGNNPNVRGEIAKDNISNRAGALKWEQKRVNAFNKKHGRAPVNQKRPKPQN